MDIIIMDILDLEASIWWWYVSVRVLLWFGCFQGGVGIWPSSLHCQPFGVYFLAPLWWRFLIYSVIYLSKKKKKEMCIEIINYPIISVVINCLLKSCFRLSAFEADTYQNYHFILQFALGHPTLCSPSYPLQNLNI